MCTDFAEHCNTAFLAEFEKFHIVEVMVRVKIRKADNIAMQMTVSRALIKRNFRSHAGITSIFHHAHRLMMRVKAVLAKGFAPRFSVRHS